MVMRLHYSLTTLEVKNKHSKNKANYNLLRAAQYKNMETVTSITWNVRERRSSSIKFRKVIGVVVKNKML